MKLSLFLLLSALLSVATGYTPRVSRSSFLKTAGVTAASTLATSVSPKQASATIPTGLAPPFSLPNTRDGTTTTLTSLLSTKKWTILYFYPGAFTSGCTLEARNFSRDYDEIKKLNAQVVGVSVDSVEKNKSFCESENLAFYMLSDAGGAISKAYGSSLSIPGFGTFSNRQTYLIDPEGRIEYVFTDVESRVARHSGEVIEKLRELQGKV
ncbi:hypothetical protein TrLO_g1571 [Triparma laevis f. longispina]|uniref:thioredoxin-dependent peroxiredoxin n=1 Tax=Triparma laevis f. longispina TaxID=1714387 RepID=A0A9W7E229_9STRA|nr:hypothetical protein TrLO_g1571 [Triparma laevis f. longispina]